MDAFIIFSESEGEGNPMVAGFQDEIDSDDEISGKGTITQSTALVGHDIDLSSEEETVHSNVQVVKYDDDYVTSEDETPTPNKLLEVKPKSYSVSSSSEIDVQLISKPKANSMSSNSDKDNSMQSRRQKSPSAELERDRSAAGDSNLSVDNKKSSEVQRKTSSASSRSGSSAIITSQKVSSKGSSDLANENSDSESDDAGVQVTVLQDTDINPDDFGGTDVFNDWLNKQEVSSIHN